MNKKELIRFWKLIIATVYQAETEVMNTLKSVPSEITDEYCEDVITKMAEWLSDPHSTKE